MGEQAGTPDGDGLRQLVVVCGAPTAERTATARRVARDLRAPLLDRERLRREVLEPIADVVPAVRPLVPEATDRLLCAAVEAVVAGGPAVLDGDRWRDALHPLVERAGLRVDELRLSTDRVHEDLAAVRRRLPPPPTTSPDDGAVIVVSGLPAAGKSTFARRLAGDLGVALVWRDGLRRRVLGELGGEGIDISPCIPAASDALVRSVVRPLLEAGRTLVLDGNFNNPMQAAAVVELLEEVGPVRTFEVCLWGDEATLRQRFIDRADPPLTDDLLPYFETVIRRERRPVLGDPTPVVHLDTTDLSVIDQRYDDLLVEVRQHLAG